MSTVAEMIAALETYPADAEMWLDLDDGVHIHTADLECHRFWDGVNLPTKHQNTITVYEDWEL